MFLSAQRQIAFRVILRVNCGGVAGGLFCGSDPCAGVGLAATGIQALAYLRYFT